MSNSAMNTRRRDQSSCLKKSHSNRWYQRILSILFKEQLPYLNDRYAKDIGLSVGEIERLRLTFPSQTNIHPRL